MKRVYKFLCVGPGGTTCTCCFPAPGSRERKLEYRRAKRREKRDAMRVEQENG